MSQAQPPSYPPNAPPPGYPPSNYPPGNVPPGNYPPGGGGLPPAGYQQPGAQRGTSVSSVLSLVCGILGCVPFLTSLLAVIFGIVGIRATSQGKRGGRPLAVIGLVLGLVGLVVWSTIGGGMAKLYLYGRPARAAAQAFITDLSNGNAAAAQARCTSDISAVEIERLIAYVKPMGVVKDVTSVGFSVNAQNGTTQSQLAGAATFANGQKPFTMVLVKDASGAFKIAGVQFDPKPGQMPGASTAPSTGN